MSMIIARKPSGQIVAISPELAKAYGYTPQTRTEKVISTPSGTITTSQFVDKTEKAPSAKELEIQEIQRVAAAGGGYSTGLTGQWKIPASQEFIAKETETAIEKQAGEDVKQVQETRSESGKLLSRHYEGLSGTVYEYKYTSGELSSFGGTQRIQVQSGNQMIPITLSPKVSEKVGGVEGLQKTMLQRQAQQTIQLAVHSAATGKGADVMFASAKEYEMHQRKELEITQKAQSVATFAYYGMNVPRTAMTGLGATLALASGVPIENIRQQEFEFRKQFVREHLNNPILRTGRELLEIGAFTALASKATYSTVGASIKGTAIAPFIKPIVISAGTVLTAKGTYELVPAVSESMKDPTLGSYTKVASSLFQMGAGASLIYAGWKMPVKYSKVTWDEPISSKKVTIGSRDIKEIVVNGRVINRLVYEGSSASQYTQHGVAKAYFGLAKKDIYITGFPETEFTTLVGGKNTYATTWTPSVGIEKVTVGKFILKQTLFYPTGYSESVSFPMAAATGKVFETVGYHGKGSVSFPDLTGNIKQFGSISRNVVFEATNIKTGFSYSISEPKLISSVSKEVVPPSTDTIVATEGYLGRGSIRTINFDAPEPKEVDIRSIFDSKGITSTFKQLKGGEYIFNPTKTFEKSAILSREPIISLSSGGGRGTVSMTKPPDSGIFGGAGTSSFETMGMQPTVLKQFGATVASSASMWKPFDTAKRTYQESTPVIYPPGERNVIISTSENIQKQMTIQKPALATGVSMQTGLQRQLGLQSQVQQGLQSSIGTQAQQSLSLQAQQQLQQQLQQQMQQQSQLQQQHLQQMQMQKFQNIVTAPPFNISSSGGKSDVKLIIKSPFKAPKVLRISKLMKPTASLVSLERAASIYGKGSLARGAKVESIFREQVRTAGISLEFPAAEFIRGYKPKKKRRKRK